MNISDFVCACVAPKLTVLKEKWSISTKNILYQPHTEIFINLFIIADNEFSAIISDRIFNYENELIIEIAILKLNVT